MGWLYRTHVHFSLKGSDCTILAFEVGVENIVKLVEKVPEFSLLVVTEHVVWIHLDRIRMAAMGMVSSDFGVYVLDAVGFSCRCFVLTLQKCSLRLRCRGALVRFGMRNFPETLLRRDGVGHISVHSSLLHGCGSTANVESECATSDSYSTSTNSPGQSVVDSEGTRTMCVLRRACLCISVSKNLYWYTESFPIST